MRRLKVFPPLRKSIARTVSPAGIFFLIMGSSSAQEYVVSTLAGGAPPPTPAIATADSIPPPFGITVDPAGNVFFTSAGCVFQLDRSGILTRFAGTPRASSLGDGGPALKARIGGGGGLRFDPAGNLYIADARTYRVRKIATNGIISTIAGRGSGGFTQTADGEPAVSASVWWPVDVVADGAGNVFFSDEAYGVVRKVSSDGLMSTVFSGSRSSSIGGSPSMGLAMDGAGNLFVSDGNNHVIRKVSPAGTVTIAAGTGVSGFSGDGGPATAAQIAKPRGLAVDATGNLYFVDSLNYRVRKVDAAGLITTVAGGGKVFPGDAVMATQANLFDPIALAVGNDGSLYLSAGWIQKISPDGMISIIAGNGTYNFGGDGGPAIDAQLNTPTDVTHDGNGNVFIVDEANVMVRRVDRQGTITTVAGDGSCGYSGDGGPATKASFCYPSGVAVDRSGNLYIADSRNNRIRKVSPAGTIATFAGNGITGASGDGGPATRASLNYPLGVATDDAGNVFIADYQGHRVRKVSKEGIISTVAGTGVQGFSGDGGPATAARIFIPRSVAVDGAGNLFIADTGNGRIRKVSADGIISTVAGNGASNFPVDGALAVNGGLGSPGNVALDTAGNIFISSAFGRILRVSPDGRIRSITSNIGSTIAGDGVPASTAVLGTSNGLTIDSTGRIYVVAAGMVRVLEPVDRSVVIGAVTDAASQTTAPLSPGKIVVIYGAGMGPAQLVLNQPVSGVYATQAAGTEVFFNGIPGPLLYTSAAQVAAVVPYAITGPTAQVTVRYQGSESYGVSVPVAVSAPALFSSNGTGAGQIAAVNGDGSLNDAAHPVKIGDHLSLYATGEGGSDPPVPDGRVAASVPPFSQPQLPVNISVDGYRANVLYAGAAPGQVAGLMQISIQIPEGVHPGGYVPVELEVGAASTLKGALWISVSDKAGSN